MSKEDVLGPGYSGGDRVFIPPGKNRSPQEIAIDMVNSILNPAPTTTVPEKPKDALQIQTSKTSRAGVERQDYLINFWEEPGLILEKSWNPFLVFALGFIVYKYILK